MQSENRFLNFNQAVKDEITEKYKLKECCSKALLYGFLLFSDLFSSDKPEFKTKHESVARFISRLIKQLTASNTAVIENANTRNSFLKVKIIPRYTKEEFFSFFGHSVNQAFQHINLANLDCEDCYKEFMAGVFLAAGYISDPKRYDYRLELIPGYRTVARELVCLIDDIGFCFNQTTRRGKQVLYTRDSTQIEDFLTYIGAVNSSLELMNIKIYKDLRNKTNRLTNCETSNLDKTLGASQKQIEAITKIDKKIGISSLPPELSEIARLRLDNMELSLSELSKLLQTPLSRSGINHRLQKIIQIAEDL